MDDTIASRARARPRPWLAAGLALLSFTACVDPAHAEFMTGADISALPVLEDHGAVYKDAGRPGDLVPMFREHGVNWFRLRLFVNPNGQDVVVNNLAYTIELAQRVKASGAKLLLDFHYSDTWADPGHQSKPAAWNSLTQAALIQKVHDYTRDSILAMKDQGALPDMVQIGNEIPSGMLYNSASPATNNGYVWTGGNNDVGFDRLAALLNAGISGAKEGATAGPNPGAEPLIMIHHDRGDQWGATSYYFDKLTARNVDFDVIGYSFYPKFHTTIANVQTTVNNTATRYGKPVVLVEAGFPSNGAQFEPKSYEFPVTPEGQRAYLQSLVDIMQNAPNGLGQGVFWWYPEATPVAGLNVYEGGRYGLFDPNANLTPAIDVFSTINPPLAGDYDFNGVIDGRDLDVLVGLFGESGVNLDADGNNDGVVDGADFVLWQRQMNAAGPGASASAGPVPEPLSATIALILFPAAARLLAGAGRSRHLAF